MSNVLSDEKKQQVLALGRLGWTLRSIEQATGVRRETASNYLKAAGIDVHPPGRRGRRGSAKRAIEVTTGTEAAKPAIQVITDFCWEKAPKPAIQVSSAPAKPAIEVITDFCREKLPKPVIETPTDSEPKRSRSISACEPYREIIEQALDRGRNSMAIWQDLVTQYGFERGYQSVKRFANKIRPSQVLQARPVIVTAPGEDYGEFRSMLRSALPVGLFPHYLH
jgi:transposase